MKSRRGAVRSVRESLISETSSANDALNRRHAIKLGSIASATTGVSLFLGTNPTSAAAEPLPTIESEALEAAFAALIYDSSTGSGATAEDRLKSIINKAVTEKKEIRVRITEKIVLTTTLVIDVGYISIDNLSGAIDATQVGGRAAVTVLNSRSFSEELAGGIANNRRSIRGLSLSGPGRSALGSIGILFDSAVGNNRGIAFYDIEIKNFETGISFRNNSYLLSFFNYHIHNYDVGIHMPAKCKNYGENLRFFGGGIGTGRRAIWNQNSSGNFHLFSPSIDFATEVAVADAGGILLTQPHIELNSTESRVVGPVITTGSNRGRVVINGGLLMFHQEPAVDFLFSTSNTFWGGGVYLSNVELFKAQTQTGFLCGGTGNLVTRDLVYYDGNGSGAGGGSILTSKAKNRLIDGNFNLPSIVDAYLTRPEATTRTSSPAAELTIGTGYLHISKKTTGFAEFVLDVPIREPGREYAASFTISEILGLKGNLFVNEQFVALGDRDSRNIPSVMRFTERPASTYNLSSAELPLSKAYGSGSWNRVAPGWATHFRIKFNISSVGLGSLKVSEVIITDR
ncbi:MULTISPECIES: hypothetical protein [unclassified Pseudarthrobacter]|uniref:hypothetical protein n=1 Tax=unclassified Pseudarthrobacter TaxID=2647000 RepID=UPI003077B045